jgi:integrase
LPTERDRGDAFEAFAEAYIATQKLVGAEEVWPGNQVPIAVLQACSLPVKDLGADGIYKTWAGQYNAYQSKFRTINVVQQKTGKELWIPLQLELAAEMRGWEIGASGLFVETPRQEAYSSETFRAACTRFMNDMPAGRIRRSGFVFHGLRASSCEKLREAGCDDAGIESITGMSQAMIKRYLRFADQRRLAKAAVSRLERAAAPVAPTVKSSQD